MTADEFLQVIRYGYYQARNGARLYFKEEDGYVIKDIKVEEAVAFTTNTIFGTRLRFVNVEFYSLDIINSQFANEIEFENCVFSGKVRMIAEFRRNLSCIGCVFKADVLIQNNFQSYAFWNDCNLESKLTLIGTQKPIYSIAGSNCDLIIVESNPERIELKNNNIKLLAFNKSNTNVFECEENEIDEIQFAKSRVGAVNISGLSLNGNFELSDVSIDMLSLENVKGPGRVEMHAGRLKKTEIQYCFFDTIHITDEILNGQSVSIQGCSFRQLSFIDFKNGGSCKLVETEIPENGRLTMVNCDLGKTNFLRCNFKNCAFEFENSKVPEIFLAETDFPKKVFIGDVLNYHQAQLVFGQLQNTYQKQGDSIRANEYLSREVEAHYYTLPWFEKRIRFKFRQKFRSLPWFSKSIFTKVSLFLNKWSNDFGRNWWRGVVFSFGMGLLFFYFLLLTSDEYHFTMTPHFKSSLVAPFLKFMNPLRHFETQNLFSESSTVTLEPNSYVIDFLARIFVAYGFYQTIQAFRRYGKK